MSIKELEYTDRESYIASLKPTEYEISWAQCQEADFW